MELSVNALTWWLSLEQQRLDRIIKLHPELHDLRVHLDGPLHEQGILVSANVGEHVNRLFLTVYDHTLWAMPYFEYSPKPLPYHSPFERHHPPWARKTFVHPDPPSFRVAHMDDKGRLRKVYTWGQRMQKAGIPLSFIEEHHEEVEAFYQQCRENRSYV